MDAFEEDFPRYYSSIQNLYVNQKIVILNVIEMILMLADVREYHRIDDREVRLRCKTDISYRGWPAKFCTAYP